MPMPDHWIRRMAIEHKMIEPFAPDQVRGGISFGTSSYGYDFRICERFLIPKEGTGLLDPKAVKDELFTEFNGPYYDLPAGSYCMARTVEYFRIPRDVLTIATGKSTYARCGVTLYVTPFEPEWEGFATIAVVNSNSRPVRVYANEGIGQLVFLSAKEVCATSYADKQGKYQAQTDITHAKSG